MICFFFFLAACTMTDSMKLIISDLCHGMRDAVLGALFIFRVDAEINALAEEKKRRQEEKRRETQRRPIPVREKKERSAKVDSNGDTSFLIYR